MKTYVSKSQIATVFALLVVLIPLGVSAATPPQPTAAGGTIDQRIAQRKAERGTVLSDTDSKRLVSSCARVQDKLRTIQTAAVPNLQNYLDTYHKVDARLWLVTGKLKLAKQDTFELEKQRLAFVDKVNAFEATDNSYQQVLDDSIVINCQADPVGFQALLDTARLYQDQLRTQSMDTRNYIVNTLKPTLGNYVSALQPKTPTAGDAN